jgi:hypothetical protein
MLKISTNDLTWNPKSFTFSTEASDLEPRGWRVGASVTLFNPKTGGEALFKYVSIIHGLAGDHAAWRYLCQRPGLPDLCLEVFND